MHTDVKKENNKGRIKRDEGGTGRGQRKEKKQ